MSHEEDRIWRVERRVHVLYEAFKAQREMGGTPTLACFSSKREKMDFDVLALYNGGFTVAQAIQRTVMAECGIQRPGFRGIHLGDEDVKVLVEAMREDRGTKQYDCDLRDNRITDEGARLLALALKTNRTIKLLRIGGNKLTAHGRDLLIATWCVNDVVKFDF